MRQYLYSVATDQRSDVFTQCLKVVLLLFSFLYGCVTSLRNYCYDQGVLKVHSAGRPVISIGNITMGGVGKTPLVIQVAKYIQRRGYSPAILIRGYMSGNQSADSDESTLLKSKLTDVSVLEGADRVASVQNFLKSNTCDVFIMDDGFQHRRLHRDLDILAVDSTDPFGNQKLIPRGILRESLRGCNRADAVVFTRMDMCKETIDVSKKEICKYNKNVSIHESIHQPSVFKALGESMDSDTDIDIDIDLEDLRGECVLAFCGIGNPKAFKETLGQLGIEVAEFTEFIDHHTYTQSDIKILVELAKNKNISRIVTTQKDAVKIKYFADQFPLGIDVLYLEIDLQITKGKSDFYARIDHLLQR